MDIKCKNVEWAGLKRLINKPGVVELSVIDGQAIKIPLTVLTHVRPLTSGIWMIAGQSYDIFAPPTQKKEPIKESAQTK